MGMLLTASVMGDAAAPTSVLALDKAGTHTSFDVVMLGLLHTHGVFNDISGKLVLDAEAKRATLDVVIHTASLSTGYPSRDALLRSKTFFDVDAYPLATVTANNITLDVDHATVNGGSLTLRGLTRPITLAISDLRCQHRESDARLVCDGHVVTTIQRSQWGMDRYAMFVRDDVTISVDVEAVGVE